VPTDANAVDQVWKLVQDVQMGCPVITRRSAENGGLGQGVVDAISWFFELEKEGIILEDDVCISPSSLTLAHQLLTAFRNVPDVGSVTLFSPPPARELREPSATYRFSRLPSSQYWGTWRSRWEHLTPTLLGWRAQMEPDTLERIGGLRFARYFAESMDKEVAAGFTAWEGRWIATHWMNGWRVVTTNANYSLHIGFTPTASNSVEQPSWYPTSAADWAGDYREPMKQDTDSRADKWQINQRFGLSNTKRAKRFLGRAVPGLRAAWRRRRVRPITPGPSSQSRISP
jgi:hypothetical protein